MLHKIHDSPYRARLLEVVALQKKLVQALCALPAGSTVDLAWLKITWPTIGDEIWMRRFWENDSGNREKWCITIAKAEQSVKLEIVEMLEEQLRFRELYSDPPTVRLQVHAWRPSEHSSGAARDRLVAMEAAQRLLEAFYVPLFYSSEGYPNADGSRFHKDHYIGKQKICPYTDNKIQDAKLDHFLPKESFPALSCHPDNLIPCSTDPNSVGRKGRKIPLQYDQLDQAAEWFHPLFRPAKDLFTLTFENPGVLEPTVHFVAINSVDQPRLERMADMFGLVEFWSRDLDDELQLVSSEVERELNERGVAPTKAAIQAQLVKLARQKKNRIGHDPLAIVTAAFYEHILNTPLYFAQVERTCIKGI